MKPIYFWIEKFNDGTLWFIESCEIFPIMYSFWFQTLESWEIGQLLGGN